MSIVKTKPSRRGRLLERDHAYHQGWYPLALSSELPPGAVIGRGFLGGRVVLYRDAAGKPVVQSGYCPHLGADLSLGDIAEGQIRCAFHHWCFDAKGRCSRIPTQEKIPPGARIFTYASAEAWGLVWAFTGEAPLFGLPCIPRAEEGAVVYRVQTNGVAPYEPWLPVSNGLDFQHLRALHGIVISEPESIEVRDHSIEYTFSEPGMVRHGLITGTNTFSLYRYDQGHETFSLFSGTPIEPGATMVFSVVGLRDTRPETDEEREALEQRLSAHAARTARLLEEDERVLETLRVRPGILVAADRYLAR
ncbi:MAG TPA: Rieske 2Fe-2S domain-containing protein, partial [Candidatus Nanopelagicales bacterium]|nr:Rieske 2Fe-2S domain-containing protein [Candidatus Nanopelagicales bacterium]